MRKSVASAKGARRWARMILWGTLGSLSWTLSWTPAWAQNALDSAELGKAWHQERYVQTPAPCLRPAELEATLRRLVADHPRSLRLEEVGRSVQGRPIHLLSLGHGPTKVLLWSQMHGDEPSATPALLDLADYLVRHADDPAVARLLESLTLLMVPMLNPDGAEVYSRRNAQAIDINRDALNLATPEGRLLKRLRDDHQPILGFNLHDQNRRRTVGQTGVLASNAVLAVVGDEAKTLTPGRVLAQRACVAIAAALEPWAPGGLARYDDTFSPRSFGDNLTAWGTPVVLIESGGVPPGQSLEELTRLNFVALGTVLGELAADELQSRDPRSYERIPENNIDLWSDVVIRGSLVRQPPAPQPYRADVAFDQRRGDRELFGCTHRLGSSSEITELGDARIFAAGREIDGRDAMVLPLFLVGARGWSARSWMTDAGMAALAQRGVARVRWWVPAAKVGLAQAMAEAITGPGKARLEILRDEAQLPPVVLRQLPAEPHDASLAAWIATLFRAARRATPELEEALTLLWPTGSRPLLTLEAPASLLVARGVPLRGDSRVDYVFLDGVELEAP